MVAFFVNAAILVTAAGASLSLGFPQCNGIKTGPALARPA